MLLMSLWFIGAQAQETVRGVVTDAAGEPLIGANVVEKGQPSNGTITNLDGKFTLKVTSNKAIIAISMIGMKTVEVTVPKDGKTLTVRLHDDTQTLDEVVVVAYGQQKKVSVTGSISAVGNRELKQGPTSSVTNSLTGRIPGLVTRQTSGCPGEDAAALYIRGRATVNDASPLIMVDGIERDFSQIDPDEIESISVLKDASATAVYGVRGANGVILVTTKRGNSGKAKVSFSGEFGITQINRIKNASFLPLADIPTPASFALYPEKVDGSLPVYSSAAGRNTTAEDAVPVSYATGAFPAGTSYLVHIQGDSMAAQIPDGCYVAVKHVEEWPRPGVIGIFTIGGGEMVCKQYIETQSGEKLLKSANSSYAPIPLTEDMDCQVYGEVIMLGRKQPAIFFME